MVVPRIKNKTTKGRVVICQDLLIFIVEIHQERISILQLVGMLPVDGIEQRYVSR